LKGGEEKEVKKVNMVNIRVDIEYLTLLKSPKKGPKVERRKNGRDGQVWEIILIYMEMS
jgi:hypothetical protein